ncbi:30S ribosomal protein S17 [Mycoplasmopsis columbina]|uniref:Small ribosomal subunit protein uS17 n=1 Tax=Mycoplasmopsis columbina SF7 TaxID=1037410 RepID=F9UJK7_9BACT|nr:30S ribosomal protein S17 [Mycoplasmopsis columbina]EGV00388.1 30S ribosomal protein s17 [Mycoplasmopsis columbina SF7]VEU76747.1 30S ribosomal protein S17 [Mycoplasmopsis columbina]
MERNTKTRKTLQGRVTSTRGDKTIYVEVETYRAHKLYSKRFKTTKRFAVHDELNKAQVNDVVTIMETRPLSKTKHFRLVEIKSHALESEK